MKENIFHPTDFDQIPSGSVYQMAMRFAHLANKKYHASLPTHVYCTICEKIRPVIIEGAVTSSECGKYVGGDVMCGSCRLVITSLWTEKLKMVKE